MYNFFSKRLNGNRKGFTLVELLVVMAILAVLIAIAVMNMGTTTVSAKVSRHNSQVREVFSAATMWYANNAATMTADATGVEAHLKPFFNANEVPKPEFGGATFAVTVSKDGKVKVSPGLYKVGNDGNAAVDNDANALLQGN